MKGTKLFIQVLLGAIILFVVLLFLVSGGVLTSWSAADLTKFRPLLVIILVVIARVWWRFRDKHFYKDDVLFREWHGLKIDYKKGWIPQFKIIKTNYTLSTAFEVNGWLFAGIAVFGLSTNAVLHYVFTIAGALLTFIIITKSTYRQSNKYIIGLTLGAFSWVIGFVTDYWSVYLGEVFYMLTPLVWLLNETENV